MQHEDEEGSAPYAKDGSLGKELAKEREAEAEAAERKREEKKAEVGEEKGDGKEEKGDGEVQKRIPKPSEAAHTVPA